MHIQSLYIKDFKNIKEQTFDFSSHNGLTVFIGNNGSGKSNILECISSIFYNLYQENKTFESDFFINYKMFDNTVVEIKYSNGVLEINPPIKSKENLAQQYPKRIIAIYSGEEDRLWKKYYYPLYMQYIKDINNQTKYASWPQMLYLNKFYWDIALLSVLCGSEDDKLFVKDVLGITNVNNIVFEINTKNYQNYKDSPVLELVKKLDEKRSFTLEEFTSLLIEISIDIDTLFMYLYIAFTPIDSKIIESITINFNNNITTKDLSEGQKKLLLVKAALEYTGSENTLFLLDEPDAHIHIENKTKLIDVITPYLTNRQIILTTHSPSLTDYIVKKDKRNSILYIENGEVKSIEIIDIISKLSGHHFSYIEGALMLSSKKPLILVEGVGDVNYINKAIELLSPHNEKYSKMSFDILFMGGAGENAKQFIDRIKSHIDKDRKVIVIFDRDDSGAEGMRKLGFPGDRNNFNTYKDKNWYYLMLPKTDEHDDIDFTIEDYFSLSYKNQIAIEKVNETKGYFKKIPKDLRQNVKDTLSKKIDEYTAEDMSGFSVLLDKIINIIDGVEQFEELPDSVK